MSKNFLNTEIAECVSKNSRRTRTSKKKYSKRRIFLQKRVERKKQKKKIKSWINQFPFNPLSSRFLLLSLFPFLPKKKKKEKSRRTKEKRNSEREILHQPVSLLVLDPADFFDRRPIIENVPDTVRACFVGV